MNSELSVDQAVEPQPVSGALRSDPASHGPGIEPCEFERLLQRVMEVLNARDLAAQLTSPQGIQSGPSPAR